MPTLPPIRVADDTLPNDGSCFRRGQPQATSNQGSRSSTTDLRAPRPYAATDSVFAAMREHAPADRAAAPVRSTAIPPELDGTLTIGVPGRYAHALTVAADRATDQGERAAATADELRAIVAEQRVALDTIAWIASRLLADGSHSYALAQQLELVRDLALPGGVR